MLLFTNSIRNFRAPFLLCIFIIITGSLTAVSSCTSKSSEKSASYQLMGYLLGNHEISVTPSDATSLTHINYAFANVTADGKVVLQQEHDSTNLARLTALRDYNPDLKILLSVGGWAWSDHFSDAALTKESRTRFARSAVDLVAKHRLDGLDIDWEYPGQVGQDNTYRPVDKKHFTLLLKKVRTHLDQQQQNDARDERYQLTIAAGADNDYLSHTNLGKAHQYLDYVNLMTYDFHGSWTNHTGHHSNLYQLPGMEEEPSVNTSVMRLIKTGVPANKIIVGVPFYGRGWSGVDNENNGRYQSYSKSLDGFSYDTLARHFIDKKGFVRHWDNTAKAPYLWQPDSMTFITYEDKQSLKYKVDYVKDHNLAGLMYWEHTDDSNRTLLEALNTYLSL